MMKLYQLIGELPIATVSVMCCMGESPHSCAAVLWRYPGEVSRLARVRSAFPHTAVSRISILGCLSSLPPESSWVKWVQMLEIQE